MRENYRAVYQLYSQRSRVPGRRHYERRIRDKVELKHKGKFLVIDNETGEYEIDIDDMVATKRLLVKYPDAVIYGVRIGFPTAYRISRNLSVKTR